MSFRQADSYLQLPVEQRGEATRLAGNVSQLTES